MSRSNARFAFPKNVRFRCRGCAVCCGDTETRSRHIVMLEKEAKHISEAVGNPIGEFAFRIEGRSPYIYEMRKTERGMCTFLEGDKCGIYAKRPLICRYYPFELRPLENGCFEFCVTGECPGIGEGEPLGRMFFRQLFRRAYARIVEE